MRVIFAGTPEFACMALRQLCGAGVDVALVLTQPDRPAGRGMQLHPSPVKAFAQQQGIPVAQPRSLRLDGKYPDDARSAQQAIAAAHADVMVVAAYGLILPQWMLDAMRQPGATAPTGLGCLNIHASLLPRWRGAAPIHRAIEAGDTRTGVAIMQMDAGLDTGDILLEQELAIHQHGPDADTTGSLHDRLAALGAGLLLQALQQASDGLLQPRAQAVDGVTYAHKVEKAQARIDWSADAALLERRIRAFNPAPGAWTETASEILKLWRAELLHAPAGDGAPAGTVLGADQGGITVACGRGALRLLEVQRAGGKRMDAAAFARGAGLRPGMVLGALPAGA